MTLIEVEDPETHETFWLAVVKGKGGKEHYQRLPKSNFDVALRTPRQLEATAAFAETAATSYGKRSSPTEPAAAREVRVELPRRFARQPTKKQLRARAKQAAYAALLGEDERRSLTDLTQIRSSARFSIDNRRGRRTPVTRRAVPALEELPVPGYF